MKKSRMKILLFFLILFIILILFNSFKADTKNFKNILVIGSFGNHSLAITIDGKLWVIGDNECGQLGTGDNNNKNTWTEITTISNVKAIGAGDVHSLAITEDGKLWLTGWNEYGQLGTGDYDIRFVWTLITE